MILKQRNLKQTPLQKLVRKLKLDQMNQGHLQLTHPTNQQLDFKKLNHGQLNQLHQALL